MRIIKNEIMFLWEASGAQCLEKAGLAAVNKNSGSSESLQHLKLCKWLQAVFFQSFFPITKNPAVINNN